METFDGGLGGIIMGGTWDGWKETCVVEERWTDVED